MKNLIFILSLCLLSSINLFAQKSFTAKVVGVVDGDTITVITKEKRQLMFWINDIDAPEKEQDFGSNARQFLSDLVLDQTVTISNTNVNCLNNYSATVTFKNKDLSLWLVESGNAWADSRCQTNEVLIKAELSAKERIIGLWQNPNAVRPSAFLKAKQEQSKPQITQTSERRIFTGLAPTPPPILTPEGKPSGIYVEMTIDDFIGICGEKGQKSDTFYSDGGYQSYTLRFLNTEENKSKGCNGSFAFKKRNSNSVFKLDYYSQ